MIYIIWWAHVPRDTSGVQLQNAKKHWNKNQQEFKEVTEKWKVSEQGVWDQHKKRLHDLKKRAVEEKAVNIEGKKSFPEMIQR